MQLLTTIQRRSFGVLIVFAVLSSMGLALVPKLSLQYLPSTQEPSLSVQVSWPGASARTVEQDVVTPLEGSFSLIEGLSKISSRSERGRGYITIEVKEGADLDLLRFELSGRIRQIFPDLPEEISYPTIHSLDPEGEVEDRPLLIYSLGGQDDLSNLYVYARDQLSPLLSTARGVDRIDVRGGTDQEWRITYHDDRLKNFGLNTADIINAIRLALDDLVLGTTKMDDRELFVSVNNAPVVISPNTLEELVLGSRNGQIIYLHDVAKVQRIDQPTFRFYRVNGENSVRLLMYAQPLTNHLEVAGHCKVLVEQVRSSLPPGYQLYLDDDATEYLRTELGKIQQRTLFSLGILFTFLLLVYRNVRYFFVIAASLIVNLAVAALLYYAFEVNLHLYALAAITVSFGLIVDNTIVTSHHLKSQANLQVIPALLASTLTTAAALVIVFFLPREWQINLTDFAKVLIINLMVSLLVATFFIPALLQRIQLTPVAQSIESGWLFRLYGRLVQSVVRRRSWVLACTILLFGTPFFLLPNEVEGWTNFNRIMNNESFKEHVRPLLNRALGGTLRLFSWYVYEGYTFRTPDETVLHVNGSLPAGSTVEQLNAVYEQIETFLRQFPKEIRRFVTNVHSGEFGQMAIYFHSEHEHTFPYILKNRLISYSTNMGGVDWSVYGVGRAFSNSSGGSPPSFRVTMYGYNDEKLGSQSQVLANLLLKHPRIQEVNTDANQSWYSRDRHAFHLHLDARSAATYGLSNQDIVAAFRDFDQSQYPDYYARGRDPIRLIAHDRKQNDLWRWQNETHRIDSLAFKFASLGQISKEKIPTAIYKEDQQYIRTIEFQYNGSFRFGSRYLDETLDQLALMMPLGYHAERRTFQRSSDELKRYGLLLLVMGLIFFICAIQFESFRQALSIVLLIPMSFIGIFLVFYWISGSFDQGGYTSFILLSGLVVNSLILIFNDFNFFRKQEKEISRFSAFMLAMQQKFTPIVLTIVSTTLGMIPFLMHGRDEVFWYALALGTIGGLVFSLIILLFVMPCVLLQHSDLKQLA